MTSHVRWAATASLLALAVLLPARSPAQQRPKITGISEVRIRVGAYCRANEFYSEVLASRPGCLPGNSKSEPAGGDQEKAKLAEVVVRVAEQEARRRVERMMNKPSPQAVAVALVINRSDRTWIVSTRFENPARETALRDLKLEIDTLTGKAIDATKDRSAAGFELIEGISSQSGIMIRQIASNGSGELQHVLIQVLAWERGLELLAWVTDSGGHRTTGWSGFLVRE